MAQSSEYPELTSELYDREQDIRRLAGRITEVLMDNGTDSVHAITSLLADELLGFRFTNEEERALTAYLATSDLNELASISARAIEHTLPTDIDNYPLSKRRMISNFSESGLRPLVHFASSLLEELYTGGEPTTAAVEKLVGLQLACADLLNDKLTDKDLDSITEEELERNHNDLMALARIAEREGVSLDVESLMKIQPTVFEMLTSNDPVTTEDVNYRKRLNAMPSAARSLQAPELPTPNKLLSRYGNYIDFIEATAATKRGGYASTFGFLHKVYIDEVGNPFIVEYPHTMFDKEILSIDHPISDRLKLFEQDFHRTHDMLHNALPVYADHFMIHHPSAPITLGGYLPDYAAFGKGMRKDKSSYELGLAILHRQIMQERFDHDPSLLDGHLAVVRDILNDLVDLQAKGLCSDEIVDHVSFVIMSAAMNILPYNTGVCQELLDQYDRLKLPAAIVHPRDIYKLLIQQEVVTADKVLYDSVTPGAPKDQVIGQICRQVDDVIAVECLRSADIDYTNGEQGAESIVTALREMGIEPIGMNESLELQGRERLRWIGITASSRRLKGFNEKIHGLQTVRFWDDTSASFVDVAPVALFGKFYDHFQQHSDEYDFRVWFRGLSNTTLSHFKNLAFNPELNLGEMVAQDFPAAFGVIDRCMYALIDDNYEPLSKIDKSQLIELARHLDSTGYSVAASRLENCLRAYEVLVQEAYHATARNGQTFSDAKQNLTKKLMSLDG